MDDVDSVTLARDTSGELFLLLPNNLSLRRGFDSPGPLLPLVEELAIAGGEDQGKECMYCYRDMFLIQAKWFVHAFQPSEVYDREDGSRTKLARLCG